VTPPAAATFTNNVDRKTLEAGSGDNIIEVFLGSQDLHIHANAGNDQVYVDDMVEGSVTVNTGPEGTTGDLLDVNADSGASGDEPITVNVDQDDTVRSLRVQRNGTLRVADGAVFRKAGGGIFTVNGTIDLAGGALLMTPGFSILTLRTFLTRGYNGGSWNGTSTLGAIHSSLAAGSSAADAIGYGLGSEIATSSIGGFNVAPADVLLRYTYSGEADLSGTVNLNDFNRLAANFGQASRAWVHGDSNYDGLVNLADFNALAGNFGQAAGAEPDARHAGNRDRRDSLLAELS
jgi:hypothetical protein